MSQYDPNCEVLPYVVYSYDSAWCRCDIDSPGILVSFNWQSVIQVSYAVLRQLLFLWHSTVTALVELQYKVSVQKLLKRMQFILHGIK